MSALSLVTVVWSMIAAVTLLLGFVYAARWLIDREARADLAFTIVAISFVGVSVTELGGMYARDAAEWGVWLRWYHLPLYGLVVGTVAFIDIHLGAGRRWLLWAVVGLRTVILLINLFTPNPNFNFDAIHSMERVPFFGETVSIVGDSEPGRWQFLGTLASLLLVAYVLDASIAAWRRGDADRRRAAILVGGSVFLMTLSASIYAQLVIYDVLQLPFLITIAFLPPLMAMSFELGYDMLRASRLARQLYDSQRRLELAAGSADIGLWEWDGRRGTVFATQKARAIFGLSDGQAGNFRNWLAKIHPDDARRVTQEMSQAVDSGEDYSTEFRIRPDEVKTRWILARGRAEPSEHGRPAQVRGTLRDISEQRHAQDETHELRRELAHAGRVSIVGQLSSSLAHEIAQPLSAILRNAEAAGMLLESKSPDQEELKAIVADILRDDRRARDVIDRLRTLLKRRDVEFQRVDADAVMQDVVSLVRADAASRHVALEHVSTPGLPSVDGDRVQLSQVLLNLVINAMDAVAGLPAVRRVVRLSSRLAPDGQVELSVSDSGPGIAPDVAARIFEPFYTTKSSGLGMGLSISRTIAETHGGTLQVDADDGGGATFRMRLPAWEGPVT